MPEIKIVFLLYLRDPQLQSITTTKQLVEYMSMGCLNDEQITTLNQYLVNVKGQQLCIVMDGFDEYPSSMQKFSFIVNIINGKVLPKAIVVITSRPTATVSLHHKIDRRIDILGLPKEEREKYILQIFSNSPEKKDQLEKYLKQQPVINGLCFVPLHLAILLYLFQQGSLPETLTEMNESFILHTIYRHLEKHGLTPSGPVDKLANVPKPVLEIVYKLSELAFKGLQENKLVFAFDEIKQTCPHIDETVGAINGFGLLQAVEHYPRKGAGTTKSFNFLHFTMQEFLAALHASTLPSEQQSSLMKKTFWDGHYNFMWMMFVGIVGIKSDTFVNFIGSKRKVYARKSGIRMSENILSDKRKRLHVFQCYMEAKSTTEAPKVISDMFKDGKVIIDKVKLLPHHLSSLMTFMSNSSMQWRRLELRECKITDVGMNVLEQFMSERMSTLECIDLSGNESSPWGVYSVIIRNCCIDKLTLCGDHGMKEYVNELTKCLQNNTSIQLLKLKNITKKGFKPIFDVKTLQKLDLKNNDLSDDGAATLSDGLKSNNTLLEFNMSSNKITNVGAKKIGEAIQVNVALQILDIHSNRISDDGAAAISDGLKSNNTLLEFNMSSNQITNVGAKKIGEAIQVNTALQILDIHSNRISDDGAAAISDGLKSNNTLLELNISHNSIADKGTQEITKAILINSSLQNINISKNYVSSEGLLYFMEAVNNNRILQVVNITHNNVTRSGFTNIKKCIENLQHPIQIIASWNEINKYGTLVAKIYKTCTPDTTEDDRWSFEDYDPDYLVTALSECLKEDNRALKLILYIKKITNVGAKKIGEAIQVNTALQILDIDSNRISDDGAAAISDGLKSNNSLQELNMSNNEITSEGAKKIGKAIKVNTTLQKLHIDINRISDDGAAAISDGLKSNNSLQELNMSNNEITSEGAKKIGKAIKVNTTLQKLHIYNNRISDDGAAAISDGLKSNHSLQSLNMDSNNITSEGAKKIGEAIQINTTLQNLAIRHNTISDDGISAISDGLKNNISLKELEMAYNQITSEGAIKIGEAIQMNTTLQKLNIMDNRISDDGAAAISDGLKSNLSLQSLNMGSNNITSEGAKKIGEAIQVNTALQKLDIRRNQISDDGATAIRDGLKSNNSLQELDMAYNKITSEEAKKIAEAIKVNTTLHALNLYQYNTNDALSFNMTVLTAVYHNNTLTQLWLPHVRGDDKRLVSRELEKINKERTRQGISTLTCFY